MLNLRSLWVRVCSRWRQARTLEELADRVLVAEVKARLRREREMRQDEIRQSIRNLMLEQRAAKGQAEMAYWGSPVPFGTVADLRKHLNGRSE